MKLTATLLSITTILSTALAAQNTTRENHLKTCLKPHQPGKERFENLYLQAYHTGAGENDATFTSNRSAMLAAGWLSPTNITSKTGQKFSQQAIDLGTTFPWQMIMAENVNFYAAWQPVRINAGLGSGDDSGETGGFFINATGLQWNSNPGETSGNGFGGWLVCDWWHNVPQLFFRISYYDATTPAPRGCADVNLYPEYF